MTRSMQPTLQAVERITPPAGPSVSRLAYSYQRGYEDGMQHGKRRAIRLLALAALPLLMIGYLTACAVSLM